MPNLQLTEYITTRIAQGASKEEVKSALLGAGWQEAPIDEAWHAVFPGSAAAKMGSRSKGLIVALLVLLGLLLAGGGFAYYWYFVYGSPISAARKKTVQMNFVPGTSTSDEIEKQKDSSDPMSINYTVENNSPLKFTFPLPGTIVREGEALQIRIDAPKNIDEEKGVALVSPAWGLQSRIDHAFPYEFNVDMPEDVDLGPFYFSAFAVTTGKESLSAQMAVDIEAPINASVLSIRQKERYTENNPSIVLPYTYSPDDEAFLHIVASFSDGKDRDITLSSETKYESQDEKVAEVVMSQDGMRNFVNVRGVKEGKTDVLITYRQQSLTIPVTIQSSNSRPVAKILPEHDGSYSELAPVRIGTVVTLDGSQSYDLNGDELVFDWVLMSKPQTSVASIVNSNKSIASITPDKSGFYSFQLTVKDGYGGERFDLGAFTASGLFSQNQSTLVASDSKLRADGKEKAHITVMLKSDDGTPVVDEPVTLFRYLGTAELPMGCLGTDIKYTDASGKALFEVSFGVKLGPTIFFAKAGGCKGMRIESEVTIDLY